MLSTIGYKTVSGKIFEKLRIHDTCGVRLISLGDVVDPAFVAQVNNLHGMPGILGGALSVLAVMMAS